ncbi:hypothetical protein Misp04_25460 [Micromonospora sp. NBRC 101691]|nr:hypothetical protein Misp04_25460 [Micromonospora sp. NBRC 101691]
MAFHRYGAQHLTETHRLFGGRSGPDADGRRRRLDAMEALVTWLVEAAEGSGRTDHRNWSARPRNT